MQIFVLTILLGARHNSMRSLVQNRIIFLDERVLKTVGLWFCLKQLLNESRCQFENYVTFKQTGEPPSITESLKRPSIYKGKIM